MHSLGVIIGLGFCLGMRHATDPDHVIAVSTIAMRYRSPRQAIAVGMAWGIGHTLTLLVVGGGVVLLGWVIPERLGLSLELSVGIMLVVLGAITLEGALRRVKERMTETADEEGVTHTHPHRHGDYIHSHAHHHHPDAHPHAADQTPLARVDRRLGGLRVYRFLRPFVVGIVHGLAGSAAVALLVLAAIGDSGWALAYLLVFGLGTVLGMMLVTGMMAWPLAGAAARSAHWRHRLRLAAGMISLGFGLAIAYRVVA